MNYFSWLASCRLIQLNLGAWWGRKKCLEQQLGRGISLGSALDCGGGIKLTVIFTI